MLIRFRVANHRSICDEQEFSYVAAPLKEHDEKLINVEKYRINLLRAAGIYGANASGKSTVLHALEFLTNAVLNSHRSWEPDGGIPREPFLLAPNKLEEPSLFEIDFLKDGIRYTYGFIINSVRVLEEWLFAYPQGKQQKWFVRNIEASDEFSFSRFLTGENKATQSLTRKNSLFLSAAAQNNHPTLTPLFEWFSTSLRFIDVAPRRSEASTARKCGDPKYQAQILKIMKGADLGISGINYEEEEASDTTKQLLGVLFANSPDVLKKMLDSPMPKISFRHHFKDSGTDISLPLESESRGTQALFALAGHVVETLADGGVLCIDELDSSLHPLLAITVVNIFDDPKSNTNNAQLLFNTHDTNILEYGNLRRDQIWFTEKDDNGATHLYSLTDYKPRKEENIKRGYLQGRYGGVPFIRIPKNLFSDGHNG
ncbi:MAG: ATP-binding protein [Acidobacteria bacterium]|nr:ATP-binding protein [Acidobacteriota bacterium]